MAASDSWDLQGMSGGVPVESGQTFTAGTGPSRGLQVLTTSSFDYTIVSPRGTTAVVSLSGSGEGLYIGGPIVALTVTSGGVQVYPSSTDYTVV